MTKSNIGSTELDASPRARRKQARPAELVDAAFALFLERGYSATRIEDVAQRAGVSKGTLYLYFQSKEQLLQAAVEQQLLPRLGALAEAVEANQGSAWDQLQRVLAMLWETAMGSQLSGLPKLMVAECHNFPDLAKSFVAKWIVPVQDRLLNQIIRRGMARGEFEVSDPDYAVRVIIGGLVFLLIWRHSLADFDPRGFDPERQRRAWLEMLKRGLGARSAAGLGAIVVPAEEKVDGP